ncbi:phosphoribosyltransferase family protein [Pseudomonas sp. Marseille-QA0332]
MNCQLAMKNLVYKCANIKQSCLLCDRDAQQPLPLCMDCEAELPWLDARCRICALPLPLDGLACATCHRRRPAYQRVEALWHYGFPVDTLITRFKHNAQWPVGHLLAAQLGQALSYRFTQGLPRPDLLLPVPLARRRLRLRGFNQAAMLARWLSRQLSIRCEDGLLQRTRDTPAQQSLSAASRRRNLRHAFGLRQAAVVQGLHLALVDDVLTTGATAQALAALLRQAGARRVDVYCLARTAKPGQC